MLRCNFLSIGAGDVARGIACALALGVPVAAVAGCGGSSHSPAAAVLTSTGSSTASSGSTAATTAHGSAAAPRGTVTSGASGRTSQRGGQVHGQQGTPAANSTSRADDAPANVTSGGGGSGDKRDSSHGGAVHRPAGGSGGKSIVAATPHSGSSSGTSVSSTPNAENGVPYEVHTAAMEPTYKPFTMVYYDPTQTHPQLGQTILFYLPAGAEEGTCASAEVGGRACAVASPGISHNLSLARVVGLPGEEIAIHNGLVVRNGQPVSEPGIAPCGERELADEPGCEYPKAITVPAESYYVMADNRLIFQDDSRGFGAVPQAAVVGALLGS